MPAAHRHRRQTAGCFHTAGFTLLELVVAITLSAIVAAAATSLLRLPVDSYFTQTRRSGLVDTSDRISRVISEDLRTALPRSVRITSVGNRRVLQMLSVLDVVFYQDQATAPLGTPLPQTLSFVAPGDTGFYAFGQFTSNPVGNFLVVNHTGAGTGNAYALANVITQMVVAPGAAVNNADPVTLPVVLPFRNGPSPTGRMFVVSGPVTYVCNIGTGQLRRYTLHNFTLAIPNNEAVPPLSTATSNTLIATGLTACRFVCAAGSANPCLTTLDLDITLAAGVVPVENTRLFHQFALENTP